MPVAPARPCSVIGCPHLQPCAEHSRKIPFATAQRSSELYRTSRWKQESKTFLQGRACVDCGRAATITDHDPPHRGNEAAFWDRGTWRPRCHPCHQAKTGREIAARMPDRRRESERHPGMILRQIDTNTAGLVERTYGSLIGMERVKQVLDAVSLILSGETKKYNKQTILSSSGQVYMERHFISERYESPQVWLHEILLPDEDPWCHDHPWDYRSIILEGEYQEEATDLKLRPYGERAILERKAEDCHRLHLTGPVRTLFLAGRNRRRWGFVTPDGWVDAAVIKAAHEDSGMTVA